MDDGSILYRRAVRLRRLTGNAQLKCQAEIEAENMTPHELIMMVLVRPFYLGFREPIVACWNLYLGLIYGMSAVLKDCSEGSQVFQASYIASLLPLMWSSSSITTSIWDRTDWPSLYGHVSA